MIGRDKARDEFWDVTKPEMSFVVAIALILIEVSSEANEDLLSEWQALPRGPGMCDRSSV